MQINRIELLQALEIVRPGLANKETIAQATSFAFFEDKVVTYNDEISISHPVENLNLVGAIRAEEFYKLLTKLTLDTIDLEVVENTVMLTSGKVKASFPFSSEIQLPVTEIGEVGSWRKLPDTFLQGLQMSLPSCAKDQSKPICTCLHISKRGFVEATDNFRLSRYLIGKRVVNQDTLIPANSVRELLKYNIVSLSEGEGWIHFKTEKGTVFSSRILNRSEKFPMLDDFLKVEGTSLKFPVAVSSALDRALVFCSSLTDKDPEVSISITGRQIIIRAEGMAGWFEEKASLKHEGTPFQFIVNPTLLSAILLDIPNCVVSESRIRFYKEPWVYVVSLVV